MTRVAILLIRDRMPRVIIKILPYLGGFSKATGLYENV